MTSKSKPSTSASKTTAAARKPVARPAAATKTAAPKGADHKAAATKATAAKSSATKSIAAKPAAHKAVAPAAPSKGAVKSAAAKAAPGHAAPRAPLKAAAAGKAPAAHTAGAARKPAAAAATKAGGSKSSAATAAAEALTPKQQKAAAREAAAEGRRPLVVPVRALTAVPEDRQSQLKQLIALGKEQSYLTYSQVNDYLPSEIVDPEQIEEIVNTINDMGIPVYEKAPDTESLLAVEPSAPSDEEAIEEAAAALAALDAELGRTTDPVRMYMREMGTVELLTREGEIRIAKRIEEGLDSVRAQIAMYPPTYEFLLKAYEPVKAGQGRLADLIVGFIDPNAPDVIAQPQNPTKPEVSAAPAGKDGGNDEEESEDGDESEEAVDTGPDPEEAARRFASIGKLFGQLLSGLEKAGTDDPKIIKLRRKLGDEFMELKLAPRMFEALIGNLRSHINGVRQLEKEIMAMAVRDAGMPRKEFITTFPKNETSDKWLARHVKAGKKYSAPAFRAPGRDREAPARARRDRGFITSRSPRSRTSTARSRSARPRPAAPRRRWSRQTCAS